MATQNVTGRMVSREVDFCRAYSMEAKEQLEKLFLKNRFPTLLNGRIVPYSPAYLERMKKERIFLQFELMKPTLKRQPSLSMELTP